MSFLPDNACFVCGPANDAGLHLEFTQNGENYETTFTPPRIYQGYAGILHGGIMATVLDEVMARFAWVMAGPAATAKMTVRYRNPAPVGVPITFRSWVTATRRSGKAYEMAATATLYDGTILAEATALVLCIDRAQLDEMSGVKIDEKVHDRSVSCT